jgi:cell division protein FtsL
MGRFNMILIIGMISFAISYISIAAQNGALFLENIPFLGYIILTTILTILLVIKTRNNFKEKKLIGMFEGGKIYG